MIKSKIYAFELTKSKVEFQPTIECQLAKAHSIDPLVNRKAKQERYVPVRHIVNNVIERWYISFNFIFGIAIKNLKWGR